MLLKQLCKRRKKNIRVGKPISLTIHNYVHVLFEGVSYKPFLHFFALELSEIRGNQDLTEIDDHAFNNCTALQKL